MKKLRLNLDDLKVESFATTPEANGQRGTVFGQTVYETDCGTTCSVPATECEGPNCTLGVECTGVGCTELIGCSGDTHCGNCTYPQQDTCQATCGVSCGCTTVGETD